jgi:hypothetical protein
MTVALAHFLPEFDLKAKHAMRGSPIELPQPVGIDPATVESMCREAADRGRAEAAAEAEAQHQASLAALAAQHRAEIAALKHEMAAVAAEVVPASIESRADAIAQAVAADVANVLAPLVEKAVAFRMVAALADEIRAACSLEGAGAVHLSGPADLVEAVRARLDGCAASITVGENGSPEITVTMDRARWSTRLEAWSDALAEALR